MMTATRNPNRRALSDRDAALVAAALALREAERRLDELLEYPDDEESHGDRMTLQVYSWQAGTAARDLEMNHADRDAGLAIASANNEKWAVLMRKIEDESLPRPARQEAVDELAALLNRDAA